MSLFALFLVCLGGDKLFTYFFIKKFGGIKKTFIFVAP
jgi:hypothetical protein